MTGGAGLRPNAIGPTTPIPFLRSSFAKDAGLICLACIAHQTFFRTQEEAAVHAADHRAEIDKAERRRRFERPWLLEP